MKNSLRILLLEDSPDDIILIERELKKSGMIFTVLPVRTKSEFENALKEFKADVILSDHSLPSFNSIEAFELYKAYSREMSLSIPFILVTGNVSEEFAVQSIKAGVDDYILKDRLKRLPLAIESALEKCRIENERLRFMKQLIAKEAMMSEAEQLAHFGSWQADLRTGKYTWSDATYSIYGFTPGEIEPDYQGFLSRVHPDDRESLENRLEALLSSGDGYEDEFRIVAPAGNIKYISCKMKIERDDAGQLIRLLGFNLDITKRKQAEIALERSEQEYRSLFDQNPDAVFSLDRKGMFTKVNKGLGDLTGFSQKELKGMDFRQFVHPEDLDRVYNNFSSSLAGKPERYEAKLGKRNGISITVDITNIPIVVNHEVIGVYGVAKDISRKKELEDLLDEVTGMGEQNGKVDH